MGVGVWKPERAALSSGGIWSWLKERTGLIDGPLFVAVSVMEFDCRYSSISRAEGSEAIPKVETVLDDGSAPVGVSGVCSSVFLRFFLSFLEELSSEASSRFLRFFLRSGSSETRTSSDISLTQSNDHVEKRLPMVSMGGSSTCMGSIVDRSTTLGSGSALCFLFFFFLGISIAIPYVSVNR